MPVWPPAILGFLKASNPQTENFQKIPSNMFWWDMNLRVVANYGKNWPLGSRRKVVWYCLQKKTSCTGDVWALMLPRLGRRHPKFSELCCPLTHACVLNLVRIGCSSADLTRKIDFSHPQSDYNAVWKPAMWLSVYNNKNVTQQ